MSLYQQEIVCDECDHHFILVTRSDEDINFCPFCANEIKYTTEDDLEETEE